MDKVYSKSMRRNYVCLTWFLFSYSDEDRGPLSPESGWPAVRNYNEVEQMQDVTNPERPTVTDRVLNVDANNYAKHET